jgi:hypothetical protein
VSKTRHKTTTSNLLGFLRTLRVLGMTTVVVLHFVVRCLSLSKAPLVFLQLR